MKIFKRFLSSRGAGFYVKNEDEQYWLGHATKTTARRTRISKDLYDALLKEVHLNRRTIHGRS